VKESWNETENKAAGSHRRINKPAMAREFQTARARSRRREPTKRANIVAALTAVIGVPTTKT